MRYGYINYTTYKAYKSNVIPMWLHRIYTLSFTYHLYRCYKGGASLAKRPYQVMEGITCIIEQRKSQRLGWLLGGRIMKIYFNNLINIGRFITFLFFYVFIIS